MYFIKLRSRLSVLIISIVVLIISLGISGMVSPALQPVTEKDIILMKSDGLDIVEVYDLSGSLIGEGKHEGILKCVAENCSHKAVLYFTTPPTNIAEYEYKFKNIQAVDLDARRVIVSGEGTISNNGQKDRFQFTATFQDNGDDTLSVRYEASTPNASFSIPEYPGTLTFSK